MPSGTIWPECLSKLASGAPAAPRGAAPRRHGAPGAAAGATLASFDKNSGQMVPDGIIMVPDGINALHLNPMVFTIIVFNTIINGSCLLIVLN